MYKDFKKYCQENGPAIYIILNSVILLIFCINCLYFTFKLDYIQKEVENSSKVIEEVEKYVTLTVYNAVESQCDDTPLITANGTKINLEKLKNDEIKYCAVSRNLLEEFPYGSILYIEGHGEYEVVDTMNKRFVDYIDILQDIDKPLFKKTNVKIIKIK